MDNFGKHLDKFGKHLYRVTVATLLIGVATLIVYVWENMYPPLPITNGETIACDTALDAGEVFRAAENGDFQPLANHLDSGDCFVVPAGFDFHVISAAQFGTYAIQISDIKVVYSDLDGWY